MDCRRALEFLEVVRPDSPDGLLPELAAAVAHVDACSHCRSTVADRNLLDRKIARTMQDVPIPAGLKDRLLAATIPADADDFGASQLEAEEAALEAVAELHDSSSSKTRGPARRTWLQAALAVTAACLCVGVGLWRFGYFEPSQVTLEDFRDSATLDLADLPDFEGDFSPERPGFGWRASPHVVVETPAKGLSLDGGTLHQIALFQFRFQVRRRTVRGALMTVPLSRVADPPPAKSFIPGNVHYVATGQGEFTTVAWTERDLVYVCVVPKSAAGRLDDLQRELRRSGLT